MKARQIREALTRIRSAGEVQRRRPAQETLAALAQLLEVWRDPTSEPRRSLAAELPTRTGFSPAVVAEGLRLALESWTGDSLLDLVESELGGAAVLDAAGARMASGFPTTAVLLAGSIPSPTLLGLIAPLCLGSPVLAKPASRDSLTAHQVAASLARIDPQLGSCLEVADFPGDDEDASRALLAADCVVASGSDETIARVAGRIEPPRRLVTYGHRFSVAALGAEASRGGCLDAAAERLALDVAVWDQLGCLSPIALFVEGDDAAVDRAAERLAEALDSLEERLPRGTLEPAIGASIVRERTEAEMRAAAGARMAIHQSPDTRWTVVREEAAILRPSPLHRFLRVHRVAGASELLAALQPGAAHLAAVGVEGFGSRTAGLARALADLGASRICPFGVMQAPPLAWCHDGWGVLRPLARTADFETPK